MTRGDRATKARYRRWLSAMGIAVYMPARQYFSSILLVGFLICPSHSFAFSADGLHTGMTLAEIKEIPNFHLKRIARLPENSNRIAPLRENNGLEKFSVDDRSYLNFCHGKLITYWKYLENPQLFTDAGKLLNSSDYLKSEYNFKFTYIGDGKNYYLSFYQWRDKSESFALSLSSIYPVSPGDLTDEEKVKDDIKFDLFTPMISYGFGEVCH